jgi:hypothetical protein
MATNKFVELLGSHLWDIVDYHLSDRARLLLYFTNNTQIFRSLTPNEEKFLEEKQYMDEYECDDGYDRWDEIYDEKDCDW